MRITKSWKIKKKKKEIVDVKKISNLWEDES